VNEFPEDPTRPAPLQPSDPSGSELSGDGGLPRESVDLSLPAAGAPQLEIGLTTPPVPGTQPTAEIPADPAWTGLDLVRLIILSIVALFLGVFAVLLIAHRWIYPHSSWGDLARVPIVVVAGQGLAYLLVLGYMYVLVTRERGRPDFFAAIHWNWPRSIAPYVAGGFVLSIALQVLAHWLPMPKNLPIDTFFRTPAEAWTLTIFGITLAPIMEELFFRGFLYPVLERGIGMTAAIFFTATGFALLHGSQLMFSWGPVLVIFLVGLVLTLVRAYKNSVAASLLIHVAYNGTISLLMFVATGGFRHLERLNQ